VTEPARLQAGRRPRLDDAAVVRAHVVDPAGEAAGRRDVERRAARAFVADEPPAGRSIVDHREAAQELLAAGPGEDARLVGVEQVNGARAVMAAATAADAVGSRGVGLGVRDDRRERHGRALRGASAGA
jgi:hypothetical protein